MEGAQFHNAEDALRFIEAGNARFTAKSIVTGDHFTYRVSKPEGKDITFVSLLTRPDNENGFSYLGIIRDKQFRTTKKSCASMDAPSAKAFNYIYRYLAEEKMWPPKVDLWHEGRCGKCGRALTVPESIERGIGPDCAERMGLL